MLKKLFCNKRYSGILWAFIVGILFFGFSILGIKLIPTKISWYIYSSVLRIVFGFICLIILNKFLGRSIKDVLSFKNPNENCIKNLDDCEQEILDEKCECEDEKSC